MKNNDTHLTEDQIIVSVIDKNDLTAPAYRHLQRCLLCREKTSEFASKLNNLSKRAETLIKPPQLNAISVFPKKRNSASKKQLLARVFFRPALGITIVALCALSIFYIPASKQNSVEDSFETKALLAEIEMDLQFASTVDTLEEYTLSGFVIPQENQDTSLDEFIEFITISNEETI